MFWSEDVVAKAIYHLRREHPDWDGNRVTAVRDNLTEALGEGRVTDFAVDLASFPGRDPHDAHVHAATVACHADILLTNDAQKDFAADPDLLPYEMWTPDELFTLVDHVAPGVVSAVIQRQIDYWVSRRGDVDLPAALREAGAPVFAEIVRRRQLML